MAIYDVNGNLIVDGTGIKSYFEEEMADTISKVKALQVEPCIVIPICTDIHYLSDNNDSNNQTFDVMIENMKYFSKKVIIDAVACLGDITDGDVAQDTTAARMQYIFSRFREIDAPLMFAAGNHDSNGYYQTPWFTLDQIAQIQYSNNRKDAVYSSGTHNWYVDMPNYNVRFIGLCSACAENTTSRYRYPTGTNTFVASALTSTPSGYIVVLLEHLAPIAAQNWNNTVQQNASGVKSAIDAWLEADNSNTLISFQGHSHADYAFTSPWLNIAINCQKTEDGITQDYTTTQEMVDQGIDKGIVGEKHWHNVAGTYKEDCWDVCVIRLNSRKVSMIRFGVGEDREFSY